MGKRGVSGDVNNFGLTAVGRNTSIFLFVAVFKKKKKKGQFLIHVMAEKKLEEWSLCTLSLESGGNGI